MRTIHFANRQFEFPGPHLGELRDCNAISNDADALRRRMQEDGYLLIRGLHARDKVLSARRVICEELQKENKLAPGSDPMDAVIASPPPDAPPGAKVGGAFWGGRKACTHHPEVLAVLEGERVMGFFSHYFGQPVLTYSYKWLRAVGNAEFTGAHYDVVYMGRGTVGKLFTTWTPMGHVPLEAGPLAICVGSHNLPGFQKVRDTYGKMDVDRDRADGWFDNDPQNILEKFGGRWATTEFQPGDALVFSMYTMHASTNNQTNRFRISSDTRYQPASEPVDERWVGDNPIAHYAWFSEPEKVRPMQKLREEWGV